MPIVSTLVATSRPVAASDTLFVTTTGIIALTGAVRAVAMGNGAIVVNHGVIVAQAVAVGDAGAFATTGQFISNYGTIQSTGAQALRWSSTTAANVTLENFGEISTIAATKAAISLDAGGNSITNHGTISSASGVAIDILLGLAGGGNTIVNTGLIATGNTAGNAVDLDRGVDNIVNAGRIVGNVALRGGADIYDGRGGTVTGRVLGGEGSDLYRLDDAGTDIAELAGQGTDVVAAGSDYALGVNVEHLLLTGNALRGLGNASNNRITGNMLDNALFGGLGNDTLSGSGGDDELRSGDGDDILLGGRGQDVMYGGAGDDRFMFLQALDSVTSGPDFIGNFRRTSDRIDLSQMDANTSAAGSQNFVFLGAASFTAAGQVRIEVDGQDMLVEVNVDADGGAEMEILLEDISFLSASDFLL